MTSKSGFLNTVQYLECGCYYQIIINLTFESPQTLVNKGVSAIHSTIPTLYRRAILPGFECFSLLKPSFLPSIIHQLFGLSDFVVARRVETKRRATGRDSSQCLTRTAEYEFQGMISTGKNKEASSFWPLVSYHFMYKLSTI